MQDVLQNKSEANIVIADPSNAVRSVFLAVLRSLGYIKVDSVATIKDVRNILRKQRIDWLITALYPLEEDNALKLLVHEGKKDDSNLGFMTLAVDGAEQRCLVEGFSYGLLSYFQKPFTKESLNKEAQELLGLHRQYNSDATLVAAEYMRRITKSFSEFEPLIALERSLTRRYDNDVMQLMKLAEAYMVANRMREGTAILSGILKQDTSLQPLIKELYEKYRNQNPAQNRNSEIGTVVIVDSDMASANICEEVLRKLGTRNIAKFGDSEEAFRWLEVNRDIDLLISEWKLFPLKGPAFLQRLKGLGMECATIIVSSLLKKEDYPLLSEMGIAHVIKKPLRRDELSIAISFTCMQDSNPSELKTLERAISRALENRDFEGAAKYREAYLKKANTPPGKVEFIEALFAFHKRDYNKAKDKTLISIKLLGHESLLSINLLGKCLMQLGDLDAANKCFKKAQSMSPQSIERLCQMADIEIQQGNTDAAEEVLEQAHSIDKDNRLVKAGDAKLAIANGDSKLAKELMGNLEYIGDIIATMNNRAIILIRSGDVKGGIKEYEKTLAAIPPTHQKSQCIVHYNLGLALVKNDDLAKAKYHLESAKKIDSDVLIKAASLLKRVNKAILSKEKVVLRTNASDVDVEEDLSAVMQEESIGPTSDDIAKSEAIALGVAGFTSVKCLRGVLELPQNYRTELVRKMLKSA